MKSTASSLYLLVALASACVIHAFTIPPQKMVRSPRTKAFMSTNAQNPLEGGALVSTLGRLDREWKLQQRAAPGTSRWSKLILPPEGGRRGVDSVSEMDPTMETVQDFVYLLEPPNRTPSAVVTFLGGAGLGQFPQVAYSEFLTRLSDRLNAVVLTVPYPVGLDHFAISQSTGELLRRAIKHCQVDPSRQYPANLPKYALSHSLGGKLQTIYMAALQPDFDGMGCISYNNFGFSQTMGMAKDMAEQLQMTKPSRSGGSTDTLSSILNLAEGVIGAIGLDFSPSKLDMNRLIATRYNAKDQSKTRLFVFDNDTLDSSRSFVESCQGGDGPSVSGLPGNHLTPVYLKPEAGSGVNGKPVGNLQELEGLVEEVCSWISGKNPTRGPKWGYVGGTSTNRYS